MSTNAGNTMLSQKELKAADALKHLDIPKIESRVLLYLFKKEGVTAREIERGVDLRQPEVSQGTNALIDRKWIKTSLIKKRASLSRCLGGVLVVLEERDSSILEESI